MKLQIKILVDTDLDYLQTAVNKFLRGIQIPVSRRNVGFSEAYTTIASKDLEPSIEYSNYLALAVPPGESGFKVEMLHHQIIIKYYNHEETNSQD